MPKPTTEPQGQSAVGKRKAEQITLDEPKKTQKREDTPEQQSISLKKIVTLGTIQSVVSELTKDSNKVALRDVIDKIAIMHNLPEKDVKSRLLKKINVSIAKKGDLVLQ